MDDKWNNEEEWEEEASEPLDRKLMVIIVLGMAVLAAIICTGLWYFTHAGKPGREGQDFIVQATKQPDTSSDGPDDGRASDGASISGSETASDGSSAGGTSTPDSETASNGSSVEGTSTPDSETASGGSSVEGTSTPDSGAASGGASLGNVSMEFTEVKESVMPKDVLNLRSTPTTTDEGNIVTQIQNGEVIVRTGINENTGWSELDYQDQILYAVSQYLTTDLEYRPPVQPSDPNRVSTIGGRIIIFTNCDDWISPKEYVNLRTEPSTSEGDNTVSCQLNYGEKVHRTGYSTDSGWSRVEHNGQILYVVTSFMLEVTLE